VTEIVADAIVIAARAVTVAAVIGTVTGTVIEIATVATTGAVIVIAEETSPVAGWSRSRISSSPV
jgi:hypothetical protein